MTRGEGTPNGMPAREQKKEKRSKVHNRETHLHLLASLRMMVPHQMLQPQPTKQNRIVKS